MKVEELVGQSRSESGDGSVSSAHNQYWRFAVLIRKEPRNQPPPGSWATTPRKVSNSLALLGAILIFVSESVSLSSKGIKHSDLLGIPYSLQS